MRTVVNVAIACGLCNVVTNEASSSTEISAPVSTYIYRRIGSISTGTNILKVRIFAVPTAWGTYNHGVLYDGTQKYVVKDT